MNDASTTTQAILEDRVFALEVALASIGGALLAPNGWDADRSLHQHVYGTTKRALRGSPFADALEQRERQLQAREAGAARTVVEASLSGAHSTVAEAAEGQPRV